MIIFYFYGNAFQVVNIPGILVGIIGVIYWTARQRELLICFLLTN